MTPEEIKKQKEATLEFKKIVDQTRASVTQLSTDQKNAVAQSFAIIQKLINSGKVGITEIKKLTNQTDVFISKISEAFKEQGKSTSALAQEFTIAATDIGLVSSNVSSEIAGMFTEIQKNAVPAEKHIEQLDKSFSELLSDIDNIDDANASLSDLSNEFEKLVEKIQKSDSDFESFTDISGDINTQLSTLAKTIATVTDNPLTDPFRFGDVDMQFSQVADELTKLSRQSIELKKALETQFADKFQIDLNSDTAMNELDRKLQELESRKTKLRLDFDAETESIDFGKLQKVEPDVLINKENVINEEIQKISAELKGLQELQIIEANLQKINAEQIKLENLKAVPQFKLIEGAVSQTFTDIQFGVRKVMPLWLQSALGVDKVFNNLQQSLEKGMTAAMVTLVAGGTELQAFGAIVQSLGASLKPLLLNPWLLIGLAIFTAYSAVNSLESAVTDISTELGVSRKQAKQLHTQILTIEASLGNQLVTQQDISAVLKTHLEEYGTILDLSDVANQRAIQFATTLGKAYGASTDEIYKMSQGLQQIGADQTMAENLTAYLAKASELSGISFATITKDLTDASDLVAERFQGMPKEAARSALEVRRLGMSLKQVGVLQDKALDISTFMRDMTELNVMTGGKANLSKFFEMRWSGASPAEMAGEVATQFDNMLAAGASEFEMKKFADTVGQTVTDLAKGAQIRKMQNKLTTEQRKTLEQHLGALSEAELADSRIAAERADQLQATERMSVEMNKLKAELTKALLPVVEALSMAFQSIAPLLRIIGFLLKVITIILTPIGALIQGMLSPLTLIGDILNGDFFRPMQRIKDSIAEADGFSGKLLLTIKGIGVVLGTLWATKKMSAFFAIGRAGFTGMLSTAKGLGASLTSAFDTKKLNVFGKVKDSILGKEGGQLMPGGKVGKARGQRTGGMFDRFTSASRKKVSSVKPDQTPSGMMNSFKSIKTTDVLKVAASMLVIAAAIFVFAKSLQELEKIEDWKTIAIGIGAFAGAMGLIGLIGPIAEKGLNALGNGLKAFGKAMMGPGILGLAALTGAAIGLGFALGLAGPGIEAFSVLIKTLADISFANILKVAGSLIVLGGSMAFLGAMSGMIVLGSLALGAFSLSLGFLSKAFSKLSGPMQIVSDSFKTFSEVANPLKLVADAISDISVNLKEMNSSIDDTDLSKLNDFKTSIVTMQTEMKSDSSIAAAGESIQAAATAASTYNETPTRTSNAQSDTSKLELLINKLIQKIDIYGDRPIVVNIGGVELKRLKQKLNAVGNFQA